jgi:hypothetical protein
MVSTTNVDGSNPGPNVATQPDTVQYPIGNVWKIGVFKLTLTPAAVATITAPVQAFSATGIGLQTTDQVEVSPPSATAGVALCSAWVSAADQLSLQWVNPTAAAATPPSGTYLVSVFRPLPEWSSGSSSVQMDW